jgi:actin-like ATPase involved in cell morphogenesis
MISIGVDFGTSCVRAAVFIGSSPQVVRFTNGVSEIPSVVSMTADSTLVGVEALACEKIPRRTIRGVKRLLGAVDEGADSNGAIDPEEIATIILRQLVEAVCEPNRSPGSAVIGVPTWFNARACAALERAARNAGLEHVDFVNEAMAIVLAHRTAEARLTAVVDVGAGGCSTSIVRVSSEGVQLLSSATDTTIGGEDIDRAMTQRVLDNLAKWYGDPSCVAGVEESIRQECERAKHALTHQNATLAWIPGPTPGGGMCRRAMRFHKGDVDTFARPIALGAAAVCRAALRDANLSLDDLSAVYMVGGMSNVPLVHEAIQNVLGVATHSHVPPQHAVAFGAAIRAAMVTGTIESLPLIDARPDHDANSETPCIPPLDTGRGEAPMPDLDEATSVEDDDEIISTTEAYAESLRAHPSEPPPRKRADASVQRADALCQHLVSKRTLPARAVGLLKEQVSAIDHDGFVKTAIEHVATAVCADVRDVLIGYLEQFVVGHERAIGVLLRKGHAADALRLVNALSESGTEDAQEAMTEGLRSPFELVRLQSLTCLSMVPGFVEWAWIAPMLVDPDPSLRRQVLEIIVDKGFPEAGLSLSRRMRSEEFDRLPDWEKRLLFEAASSVSFRRTEALAIVILEDHRFFSAAHDQSRAIAAEFLARSDAQEALEALERHAARRFSNASAVRNHAEHSAKVVRRRSAIPPASGGSV